MLKKGWVMNTYTKPILDQIKTMDIPQQRSPNMEMLIKQTRTKSILRPKTESSEIRKSLTGEDTLRRRQGRENWRGGRIPMKIGEADAVPRAFRCSCKRIKSPPQQFESETNENVCTSQNPETNENRCNPNHHSEKLHLQLRQQEAIKLQQRTTS
jgi:hypothetical protein